MLCDCVETSFPRFLWKNRILLLHPNKKYYTQTSDQEDLISIGTIGLIKAVDKFDCSYEVCFSTYAVPMIAGEIKRYLRDDGILKVSRSLKETAGKAYRIREQQEKQEAAYAGIHEEIAKIDADKKEWSIDQAQMEEQIQMSVDKEAEITGQNNVLSQQVENKNLEIESVSQDLNDVLLEIAQKQQQKNFLQQNIRRTEEEIHRLNHCKLIGYLIYGSIVRRLCSY